MWRGGRGQGSSVITTSVAPADSPRQLRLHIPLIEPDMQISRIRLSDKTSRLHPRHVAPQRGQSHEPEVPVEV
jgi:hypothetical protein